MPLARFPTLGLMRRAFELRANVAAYDACYVALAEALDWPLCTVVSSSRSCIWTKVHHAANYPPRLIIGTRNHTRDLHVADVNGERDTGGPNRASSERTHSAADRATVLSMSGRGAGPLAWPSDGQMCGGARLDPCPACAHGIPRRLPTLRRRTPREPRPPGRWAAPMNPLSSRAQPRRPAARRTDTRSPARRNIWPDGGCVASSRAAKLRQQLVRRRREYRPVFWPHCFHEWAEPGPNRRLRSIPAGQEQRDPKREPDHCRLPA